MRCPSRHTDLGLRSELWTEDPEMRDGTQGQKNGWGYARRKWRKKKGKKERGAYSEQKSDWAMWQWQGNEKKDLLGKWAEGRLPISISHSAQIPSAVGWAVPDACLWTPSSAVFFYCLTYWLSSHFYTVFPPWGLWETTCFSFNIRLKHIFCLSREM